MVGFSLFKKVKPRGIQNCPFCAGCLTRQRICQIGDGVADGLAGCHRGRACCVTGEMEGIKCNHIPCILKQVLVFWADSRVCLTAGDFDARSIPQLNPCLAEINHFQWLPYASPNIRRSELFQWPLVPKIINGPGELLRIHPGDLHSFLYLWSLFWGTKRPINGTWRWRGVVDWFVCGGLIGCVCFVRCCIAGG